MNEKRPIAHLRNIIIEAAGPYGVVPDIHEDDFIFQYSLSRNPNVVTVVKRYFDRGNYASSKLSDYVKRFSFGDRPATSVLDFASGCSCVARHFIHDLSARVVCCDIHDKAVAFIREKLRIDAALSIMSRKSWEFEKRLMSFLRFRFSRICQMPLGGHGSRGFPSCLIPADSFFLQRTDTSH